MVPGSMKSKTKENGIQSSLINYICPTQGICSNDGGKLAYVLSGQC